MTVRILIADHHVLVRSGMRLVLEQERLAVVAEAGDGLTAATAAAKTRPNIAVIDASLPQLGGLDATRCVRLACQEIRVILLGTLDERQLFEAFRSGVCGFVLKTQGVDDLLHAIRQVSQGAIYVGPQPAEALLDRLQHPHAGRFEPLSPRERQLLQLVAEGKTTKQAGAALGITFKTAEYYRTRLMRKLNLHSTAALVRYALQEHSLTATG
jgi:DNA-binding NarL/FixJ family response regulator